MTTPNETVKLRTWLVSTPRPKLESPAYGIWGVLLLYALLGLLIHSFSLVRSEWGGGFLKYAYFASPIAVLCVDFIVFMNRPTLLALSRWRPRAKDIIAGIITGMAVPAVLVFIVPGVTRVAARVSHSADFLIPVIGLAPIVEEILFRGIFLKSLKTRLPSSMGVVIIAVLAAAGHQSFWLALPFQLAVSTLYVFTDDSLASTITAHVLNNSFGLILIGLVG